MEYLLLAMAFAAGAAISIQAGVNSQLAAGLGGESAAAALVSFFIGTMILALVAAGRGTLGATIAGVPAQPLWKLSGGFLGAFFIFSAAYLAPRLGVTNMLVLIIAGQLCASMAVDQFGLMNMLQRPVSAIKLGGAAVMLAGVSIMLFGDKWFAALRS
ncbi:MAG TPA: DMT family transporter [Burkholderiaceae bacterium]